MNKYIITLFCVLGQLAQGKVLIFTYAFNRPDFIEVQHNTLEALLEDEYELVVFSDAKSKGNAQSIKDTCERLGIKHIPIPQDIHKRAYLERWPGERLDAPAVRNVNAVMYSLYNYGFDHDDILVLFDSDLFLIKPLSFRKILQDYDIAAMQIGNGYVTYLWHGLCCLNMKTLPNIRTLNFNCGKIDGKPIDAGGHSYFYLRDNPDIKVHFFNYFHTVHFRCPSCATNDSLICNHNLDLLQSKGFDNIMIDFLQNAHNVECFHDASFLHYRGGTNWNHRTAGYHQRKTAAFKKLIAHALSTGQKKHT